MPDIKPINRAEDGFKQVPYGSEAKVIQAMLSCIAAGTSVAIEGAAGIGKTTVADSIGKTWNLYTKKVMLGEIVPEEMVGYPVNDNLMERVDPDLATALRNRGVPDVVIRTTPPWWVVDTLMATLSKDTPYRGKLIFLDEGNQGGPSVQKTAAKLLREKQVGDVNLGEDTAVVLAYNDITEAIDGHLFAAPLSNRMCHLVWPVDIDVITEGFKKGGVFPEIEVPPLTKDVRTAAAAAKRAEMVRYGMFMAAAREYAHLEPSDAEAAAHAWASPRSYEMAAEVLGFAQAFGFDRDVQGMIRRGMIGEVASIGFQRFIDTMDLQDPEELIANPELVRMPPPGRSDIVLVTCESVVLALQQNLTPKRWRNAWMVMEKLGEGPFVDALIPASGEMNSLLTAAILRDVKPMLDASPLIKRIRTFAKNNKFVQGHEMPENDELDVDSGLDLG